MQFGDTAECNYALRMPATGHLSHLRCELVRFWLVTLNRGG